MYRNLELYFCARSFLCVIKLSESFNYFMRTASLVLMLFCYHEITVIEVRNIIPTYKNEPAEKCKCHMIWPKERHFKKKRGGKGKLTIENRIFVVGECVIFTLRNGYEYV